MKAKFLNQYAKRNQETGDVNDVFRYTVSGSDAELTKYRETLESQGIPVHTDEDSGKMLYFTTAYHSDNVELEVTSTGKIVVVNNKISKMEGMLKTVKDSAVKSALADRIADAMLAQFGIQGAEPAEQPAPQQPAPQAQAEEGDL